MLNIFIATFNLIMIFIALTSMHGLNQTNYILALIAIDLMVIVSRPKGE